MIRVIILKELPNEAPAPLGEMRITNLSPEGSLGDYEVEIGIEHGNSVSALHRYVRAYQRKRYNVFHLLREILIGLDHKHLELDRDPDLPRQEPSVNQKELLKAFRKVFK